MTVIIAVAVAVVSNAVVHYKADYSLFRLHSMSSRVVRIVVSTCHKEKGEGKGVEKKREKDKIKDKKKEKIKAKKKG